MEPHGQARSARPQSGNDYLAYQSGYYGQLARLPSSVGKKERYHPHREIITHIGFYAGWPKAWAAFNLAKGVWAENSAGEDAKAAFQREMIFPIGEPNTAYAQYFTGNSYLAPVSREQVNISNVTFEPRCRNNWHIHHATEGGGQMLIGVAGRGWYQEEGKPAVEILPGTVIHIPAGVKHWHGAAADSWFAHLAFEIAGENASNEWLEPVTDEEYDRLQK